MTKIKRTLKKKVVHAHSPRSSRTLSSSPWRWILVLAIVLTSLFMLRSFLPHPSPTSVGIYEVGSSAGKVDLALTPASPTTKSGDELLLTLTIDPHNYLVGDVLVELTYDQAKVGTPVLNQGTYLTDKMGTPKVENGKITFEYVPPLGSNLPTGAGTLATIKLFPTGSGTTSLAFTETTEVVVVDPETNSTVPSNMLKSASNATITIAADETTTSPSPSPSASPSLSPSPSAAASTTPEKPAKPTGLRSNCYNNGTKITLRWDAVTGASSYKLRLDQKDGSNDKSVDGITKTEYDLDLLANQNYSWWVHTTKDGIDSEEAKIDTVKCEGGSSSTPTPTPTATPKTTPKATATPKATPKASVKASPSPSSSSLSNPASPSLFPISSPGSLSDIFDQKSNDSNTADNKTVAKPGFFQMIVLGWRAILEKIANAFN